IVIGIHRRKDDGLCRLETQSVPVVRRSTEPSNFSGEFRRLDGVSPYQQMKMIFRNALCIFPDGIRDGLELVARDGTIAEIREQARASGKDVVDLGGNYLAPGFVDLHIHGALGRDTMEASAEAFRAICDYHASGGTTSLLLTTATAPIAAMVNVLNAVRDCRSSIKQIAGVHVEGPFISRAKRGAQREEFIQDPTAKVAERLLEYADVIKRVTL